jgi:hypothetical protein
MPNHHDSGNPGVETADATAAERRERVERREFTLGTILRGSVRARRRGDRRNDDLYHVDWHEPDLLLISVTIVLLSVIDAFFTVTLLRHGATEVNPFMKFLLDEHPGLFALVKLGLTGGGVLVLVAMARAHLFRVVRVKTVLHWCLLSYVALFGYEMWLLRGIF